MHVHGHVESALAKACRLDVVSFKPGNVSLLSPGHGMGADDFLQMAMVFVHVAQSDERVDSLGHGLADADENARRERDVLLAGRYERRQTRARDFVGTTVVGLAFFEQSLGDRLQHDAHRRGDGA